MSIVPVTSAANGTLKRLRSLREKKYRRAEGLFLAEGLRITTEALEAGWVPEILVFASYDELAPPPRAALHAFLQAALPAIHQRLQELPHGP